MQDRYAGDIGDYVKLAILRALSPGHRLGIAWWLHPDERHNADGKHIRYLYDPKKWQLFDRDLFCALKEIVCLGNRCVNAIERSGILQDAIFFSEQVPTVRDREEWFANALARLSGCNLIFVDPDNGLEPEASSRKPGKYVRFDELNRLLEPGRCLVVYHHHTRIESHLNQIKRCRNRLKTNVHGLSSVDALRASANSARAFFLLNASTEIRTRAQCFANRWSSYVQWYEDTDPRNLAKSVTVE